MMNGQMARWEIFGIFNVLQIEASFVLLASVKRTRGFLMMFPDFPHRQISSGVEVGILNFL